MNTVIIAAAGSGKRFGAEKPKQFLEIAGKPVLIHTLEKFERCADIDEIILVLPAAEIEDFKRDVGRYDLKKMKMPLSGGATRSESVFNGFREIDEKTSAIVLVHDGARPLVSPEEITITINKARETGAACLVAPVTDTIKRVADGIIIETIDRNTLRRALTPQAFRFAILKTAFENADLNDAATDECFLVERVGFDIAYVEGSPRNIKITHAEDLLLAEFLLK